MAVQPKLLQIPSLPKIHLKDKEIGQALKTIVQYINQNVTPKKGNRVS